MGNGNGIIEENHQPKRAEDFSLLTRIGSFFLKYNWLFALLVGLLIAAGFGWRTPQSRFEELSREIGENRQLTQIAIDALQYRADRQDAASQRLVDILDLFSIDLCLRRKNDPYIFRKLKCRDIIDDRVPYDSTR